jgi:hypothetical protein
MFPFPRLVFHGNPFYPSALIHQPSQCKESHMAAKTNPNWPVLTHYDRQHLGRIALGLGGIGTGTVSLGGRGELRDWEIVNRPAKGFVPK